MRPSPVQLLRHLAELAPVSAAGPATDAVLLERFLHQRDEAAFTALVARHGPMVLRLCRRVLGDPHDAEDAFQATFLVLARKGTAIRRRNHLAAWLHGTAYRVALKVRAARSRRRESAAALVPEPADPQPDPLTRITARELLTALDEELGRLPEAYRLPLVLCWLEGRTQEEAARQLGWTPGSVKGRLERGRARLHTRLARRGLALSAALLALDALHGPAAAGVPAALLTSTARAGVLFAAGVRNAGEAAAPSVTLAEGVLKAMLLTKLKIASALLMLAAMLGGTGLFVFRTQAGEGTESPAARAPMPPPAQASKPEEKKAMTDREKLQGAWVAVSCEANGEAQPDAVRKGFRLTIEGDRFTMRQELALHFPNGTFTLDPGEQPKAIDFVQTYGLPGEKPVRIRGIYELDGGTLKICRAVSGGKRPTDFTTTPGSGRELFVFRRPGADEPKKDAPGARKPEEKKAAADRDLLQGTWVAVAFEQNGQPQPPDKVKKWDMKLVVEGDSCVWRRGDSQGYNMGTFTLNPDRKPKEIHLAQITIHPPSYHVRKSGPFPVAGIYEIDDKTLKICLGIAGEPGPKEFTTTPRSRTDLYVFQRIAAGGPGAKAAVRDDTWSEPVKGLSGRLRIVWRQQGDFVRPEAIVELKNVQPPPVALAVSNRFLLKARVVDASGEEVQSDESSGTTKKKPASPTPPALDPEQWGLIPAGAYLGVPADHRCTGQKVDQPRQYFAVGKGVLLDLGGRKWDLRPGRYVITARLDTISSKVPPPAGATVWEGWLGLPPVEVVVPEGR